MTYILRLTLIADNASRVFQVRKEGNVIFNDALSTFYLRLYGVGHIMVYNHSDREETRKPPFRLTARALFMYHPTDRIGRLLLHQSRRTSWNEK